MQDAIERAPRDTASGAHPRAHTLANERGGRAAMHAAEPASSASARAEMAGHGREAPGVAESAAGRTEPGAFAWPAPVDIARGGSPAGRPGRPATGGPEPRPGPAPDLGSRRARLEVARAGRRRQRTLVALACLVVIVLILAVAVPRILAGLARSTADAPRAVELTAPGARASATLPAAWTLEMRPWASDHAIFESPDRSLRLDLELRTERRDLAAVLAASVAPQLAGALPALPANTETLPSGLAVLHAEIAAPDDPDLAAVAVSERGARWIAVIGPDPDSGPVVEAIVRGPGDLNAHLGELADILAGLELRAEPGA